VKPKFKTLSPHGGNQPAKLFDDAARRVSKGECKVAVITGGEALASRTFLPLSKHILLTMKQLPIAQQTVKCLPLGGLKPIRAWILCFRQPRENLEEVCGDILLVSRCPYLTSSY